jgi:hypothetical protein
MIDESAAMANISLEADNAWSLLLDRNLAEQLRLAAKQTAANRRRVENEVPHLRRDGLTIRGTSQHYLWDIDIDKRLAKELVKMIMTITNQTLYIDGTWIIEYAPGDYQGLHTDYYNCKLTFLLALHYSKHPLILATDLQNKPIADLLRCAMETPHPQGLPVWYTCHKGILLAGSDLPHHRPPAVEECRTLAICFGLA